MKEHITKKFRPKKFADVIGQPVSIATLTTAITAKQIPPAYLFVGTRGCGKTTCARLVAMALNCRNLQGAEPCGVCECCVDILNGNSDYLIEVDSATHGKVEPVRQLMASVGYYVPEGNYKVVLLDECHMLTKEAWNACLKTVEEPPARVLFIFGTTEPYKVLGTAKSRCVVCQFPAVSDLTLTDNIKHILNTEKVAYDDQAVALIAKYAYGSIRDAQSILEGFINSGKVKAEDVKQLYQTIDPNTILTYFNNVLNKDLKAASNIIGGWIRMGVSPEYVVSSLMEHLRNMIMDWFITDNALKSMLKVQKEKIGDARLASWIDFFYVQLTYIKEFPMEYSLMLDLITIKLIDTLNSPVAEKKRQTKERDVIKDAPETTASAEPPKDESPVATVVATKTATLAPLPIDRGLLDALEKVCGGMKLEISGPDWGRVTMRNAKGTIFDVVLSADKAKSPFYILSTDLERVVAGYPESMGTYVHEKVGA